jgi:small subunit ribosomal protein S5
MRERRERREEPKINIEDWNPKTEIGKMVKGGKITSIDQIFELGKPIIEHEIVDFLLPNLKSEVLKVSSTQRMSDEGRKTQFRAIVIVGDGDGHLGVGAGKADETRPSIQTALKSAKKNITKVPVGCGSWECGCHGKHSLPIKVVGRNGGVEVTLKPAPRGVGITADEVVRKVLAMAGVKDVWSFARGRTRSVYNTAMATYHALDNLNRMKIKGDWETKEKESGENV